VHLAATAPLLNDSRRLPAPRLWWRLCALGAAVLVLYDGANTIAGLAVLSGLRHPRGGSDHRAMLGHAALWDPLFLAWGAASGLRAGAAAGPAGSDEWATRLSCTGRGGTRLEYTYYVCKANISTRHGHTWCAARRLNRALALGVASGGFALALIGQQGQGGCGVEGRERQVGGHQQPDLGQAQPRERGG
jgi:hypothetical protein